MIIARIKATSIFTRNIITKKKHTTDSTDIQQKKIIFNNTISSSIFFLCLFFCAAQDRADHQNEDLSDYYLPAIYRIIRKWKNIDWITVTIHMKMDTWMVSPFDTFQSKSNQPKLMSHQKLKTLLYALINANRFRGNMWFTVRSKRLNIADLFGRVIVARSSSSFFSNF